jgi:hypothetical protein
MGFIVLWCRWIDERRPTDRLVGRTLVVAAAVALTSATYSYNRAAIVAPVLAMLGVYGARVVGIRLRYLALLAGVGLVLLAGGRAVRNANAPFSEVLTNAATRESVLKQVNLGDEIQMYTSAPQFLGYLLEATEFGRHPRYGKTVASSAMYSVPILGGPFRSSSGTVVYNRLIYGSGVSLDQVVPFQGELFLDFTFPGVLAAYLGLGFVVSRVQRSFERSRTAFGAFASQYGAIWLGFLVFGSLAVVSQVVIYFFGPVAVYAALRTREGS